MHDVENGLYFIAAAKAGVEGLTRAAAASYARCQIRVDGGLSAA